MIEAADGERADEIVAVELEPTGSKSGRVLERRRGELVDALLDDPEVDYGLGRPIGARTGLYVPLLARDQPIGVIVAHDKAGEDPRFTAEDLRLAETFATRAAVAVDQSRRVAKDALRRVIEAQELERRRLARELHDQTGQDLTSVLLGLKALEGAPDAQTQQQALEHVRIQVLETLRDVRRLAVELRPKALDDYGLAPAVSRLAENVRERQEPRSDALTPVATPAVNLAERRFASDVETAVYRMVQEALTNIVKHAEARRVSIVLAASPGSMTALIEDDGRGFDTGAARDGMGLDGMEERLGLIGGKLTIESRPEGGTTLVAKVPLT